MSTNPTDQQFDAAIRQAYAIPELTPAKQAELLAHLRAAQQPTANRRLPLARLWAFSAGAALLLLLVLTLTIGPRKVLASFQRWLGYIPGVGVVEQSSAIRTLAEPVSLTREGITVLVSRAVLTPAESQIIYGFQGVPKAAYPAQESDPGCTLPPYLLLPDGTRSELSAPIAPEIETSTFVLPCIPGTLPGAAPEDWQLPLRWVAAPADTVILPVVEAPTPRTSQENLSPTAADSASQPNPTVNITHWIETPDGYILAVLVEPGAIQNQWFTQTAPVMLQDASGAEVPYTNPREPLDLKAPVSWVIQIQGAGVHFPLRFSVPGHLLHAPNPQAEILIPLDVGAAPQVGQTWELHQKLDLVGESFELVSLTAIENGYSIHLNLGERLSSVDVTIENTQPAAGGGGGGGGGSSGQYTVSLVYETMPSGVLSLRFANPIVIQQTLALTSQWAPPEPREFPTPAVNPGQCANGATLANLDPGLPELSGWISLRQINPAPSVQIYSLNGELRYRLDERYEAVLAPDGHLAAIPSPNELTFLDLNTLNTRSLPGLYGSDLSWSPDGQWIASFSSAEIPGISLFSAQGEYIHQLSDLAYQQIAGWSPDSRLLYYAIQGASDEGFVLRSVNRETRETLDLFTLEQSSLKAPNAAVSPDGKWVAYRSFAHTSLYLKPMDGGPAQPLVADTPLPIQNIVWDPSAQWLGFSLISEQHPEGEIYLLQPAGCSILRLPASAGMSGDIKGLWIE